jgi:hypothetical protein
MSLLIKNTHHKHTVHVITHKNTHHKHCTCHYSQEHSPQTRCTCHYSQEHSPQTRCTAQSHAQTDVTPAQFQEPPRLNTSCHLHTTQLVHKIQMLSRPSPVHLQKLIIAKLPRQFQSIQATQVRHHVHNNRKATKTVPVYSSYTGSSPCSQQFSPQPSTLLRQHLTFCDQTLQCSTRLPMRAKCPAR